jgi:UDP-glucose 4-epimerase
MLPPMHRFLITGGAGFIGSHLRDAVRSSGAEVRLFGGDICDIDTAVSALDDIDGVFHLAAVPSVAHSNLAWLETHRINLTGTITMFEAIRRRCTKIPVVYASSCATYANPLTAYGADKRGCELHAEVASGIHGIPTAGLRIFNAYGPGQNPHSPYSGVISIFCDKLLAGEPVEIHGSGEQVRDFIYVADVAQALTAAMRYLLDGWRPAAPFDVCTGDGVSVLALANIIGELLNVRPKLKFVAARTGDMPHAVGNRVAMHANLGPIRITPLKVGLRNVISARPATSRKAAISSPANVTGACDQVVKQHQHRDKHDGDDDDLDDGHH